MLTITEVDSEEEEELPKEPDATTTTKIKQGNKEELDAQSEEPPRQELKAPRQDTLQKRVDHQER